MYIQIIRSFSLINYVVDAAHGVTPSVGEEMAGHQPEEIVYRGPLQAARTSSYQGSHVPSSAGTFLKPAIL